MNRGDGLFVLATQAPLLRPAHWQSHTGRDTGCRARRHGIQ